MEGPEQELRSFNAHFLAVRRMASIVATMPFDPPAPSSSAGPCDRVAAARGECEAEVSRKEDVISGATPEAGAGDENLSREPQDTGQSSSDEEDEESSEDNNENAQDEEEEDEEDDIPQETDVTRTIDWLIDVESEAADAQEALEEESLNQTREEVRAELALKLSGDELEQAVKQEMESYVEQWEDELERLQEESAKFQEQLEEAGVDLPELYKDIEKQAAESCRTEAWKKRVHWAGNPASEQVTELVKSAENYLQRERPLADKHGKFVEEGASGFLESKRKDKDGGDTWKMVAKLDEPSKGSVEEKPASLFASKEWAAVYSASTPEQAARLGLKFPGINKVDELGEIDKAGSEAVALAEESANGLTERQKKKIKRFHENDDLLEMKSYTRKKRASKHADKKKVPNGVDPHTQATQAANGVVENAQRDHPEDSTMDDVPHVPEAPKDVQTPEVEKTPDDVEKPEAEQLPKDVQKPEEEPKEVEPKEMSEGRKKSTKKPENEEGEAVMNSPSKLIIARADPPLLIVVSDDEEEYETGTRSTVHDESSRQRANELSPPWSTKKRKLVLDSSSDEGNNNNNTKKKATEHNSSTFAVLDVPSSDDDMDFPSTSRSFGCTICEASLSSRDVYSHPVLRVIVCRKCKLRYERTPFSKDEDTDAECTWCGIGGDILCCDNEKCSKVFCEGCIRKNTELYQAISTVEKWSCFVCDPAPLKDLTRRLEAARQAQVNDHTPFFPHTRVKRRKKIRAVKSDDELSEKTKKIQELENERQERLKKWYENASPGKKGRVPFGKGRASAESSDEHLCVGDCKTLGCVVNITERDTGEPLVRVPPSISRQLKPHQLSGVRFMWENCIESLSKVKSGSKGLGCILAHCMGLGKTLQVITFLYAAMRAADLKTALIVVPVNVLHNWKSEFSKWKPLEVPQLVVYLLDEMKDNLQKACCLKNWKEKGGVMLIGYAAFRILCTGKYVKEAETRALFRQYLQDPGADLLVCDEAHTIKNEKADITQELQQVKTSRRIALTGSPLQNNLMEYYCMVNFVREGLLGTPQEFRNRFQNPIENGQHADSTSSDVKKMKQRAHVLHSQLQGFVQRRDPSFLNSAIPPKCVWVISVRLSPLQKQLYKKYLSACVERRSRFENFHSLAKIWNHPDVLSIAKELAKESKADPDKDEEAADENAPAGEKEKRKVENPEVNSFEWCQEILSASDRNVIDNGSKMVLVLRLIEMSSSREDKILVFSQSLVTLNLIEAFLEKTKLPTGLGTWTRGRDWLRIDGSTPPAARQRMAGEFNDPKNTRVKCCLISTRAGSLGINLTGACRVIIVDGSWNPTHDLQALFRAWRLGQSKPVYVYRLLAYGTMEEKIYHRQLAKEATAARVLDAHQVGRHLNADDLDLLYSFEDDDDEEENNAQVVEENNADGGGAAVKARKAKPKAFIMPSDAPPRDELMAMLLLDYRPGLIANYHEHGPLLEDLQDEKLSQEEKSQAWEAFRREHEPQPGEPHDLTPAAQQAGAVPQQFVPPRPAPGFPPRPVPRPHQQSTPRPASAAAQQPACTPASHAAHLIRLGKTGRDGLTCGICFQKMV